MSGNMRNTQFMNYAMLVHNEMLAIENEGLKNNWNTIDIYRKQQELLARRSYDLVKHAFKDVDSVTIQFEEVPDMVELPKEQ